MSRDPNFTTIHTAAHLGVATLGLGNDRHDVKQVLWKKFNFTLSSGRRISRFPVDPEGVAALLPLVLPVPPPNLANLRCGWPGFLTPDDQSQRRWACPRLATNTGESPPRPAAAALMSFYVNE